MHCTMANCCRFNLNLLCYIYPPQRRCVANYMRFSGCIVIIYIIYIIWCTVFQRPQCHVRCCLQLYVQQGKIIALSCNRKSQKKQGNFTLFPLLTPSSRINHFLFCFLAWMQESNSIQSNPIRSPSPSLAAPIYTYKCIMIERPFSRGKSY